MQDLIYIGKKKKDFDKFLDFPNVMFCVVPDSVRAIRVIDRIREKFDIAVLYEKSEAPSKDLSNIKALRKIFPSVYFILVTDSLNKTERIAYLKSGINNTIPFNADESIIHDVIDFLNIRKEDKIKNFTANTDKIQVFHLPLWKRTFDIFFSITALFCFPQFF
jgi:hypothetical protein